MRFGTCTVCRKMRRILSGPSGDFECNDCWLKVSDDLLSELTRSVFAGPAPQAPKCDEPTGAA